MSLRLKILMPLLVVGALALGLLAENAHRAWRDIAAVQAVRRAEVIADQLFAAAIALAAERGITNGALAKAGGVTAGERARALAARGTGDAALRAAQDSVAADAAVAADPAVALAGTALAAARDRVEAMRRAFDAGPAPPAPADWFAATTAQIDAVDALQRAVAVSAIGGRRQDARLAALRPLLAEATEQAGRERGQMNGLITAARLPTLAEARRLGGAIARGGLALERAAALVDGLPPTVASALMAALEIWREQAVAGRGLLAQAMDEGRPYPLAAAAWWAAMTQAIDALVAAQNAATAALQTQLADRQADAWRSLVTALAGFGVALLGIAASLLLTAHGVVRPLRAAVTALDRVAGGELDIAIPQRRSPGAGRRDEVDALLAAAETLRQVSRQAREADAAAASAREAMQRERIAELRGVADRADAAMREGVGQLAGRMGALRDSAEAAAAGASVIAASGADASHAAQGALADAQSIAAATNQLSASVEEISRQVQTTAAAARSAAAEGGEGSEAIRGLTEAVNRIGGAATLIADIAGRTNLLALNATIEAARAGDSGKGFAVVASEVKQLAQQTAQATEDIARQIQSVGSAAARTTAIVGRMAESVAAVDGAAAAIAAAIEEQSVTTREIAGLIARSADASGSVAASIGNVAQEAQTAGDRLAKMQAEAVDATREVESLRVNLGRLLHAGAPEMDRREARRVSAGRMTARLEAETVEVVDLSATGAALRGASLPETGARLPLVLPLRGGEATSFEVVACESGILHGRLHFPSANAAASFAAAIEAMRGQPDDVAA